MGTLATCLYDFLMIAGDFDSTAGLAADRYCGAQLNSNPAGAAASVSVCTKLTLTFKPFIIQAELFIFFNLATANVRPFRMTYQTDTTEAAVAVAAPILIAANADALLNTGFCLNYVEI